MTTTGKLKAVDFYRKIPRDLTEASLSGASLSILAALSIFFLFGMELNNYLTVRTTTSIVVDKSKDGDFMRIDFNISFPVLSCEFASVDVSDILGTNRLNITKTIRKFSIDPNLRSMGSEFHSGPIPDVNNHGDEFEGDYSEDSVKLTGQTFDHYSHQHPILVVNFYAPWCYWSNRLRPSWEKAAKIIREGYFPRYDPEVDKRILLAKVDCTEEVDLCRRNHIQGYPSIRIYRKGSDVRENQGHHEHESYYGDRDTGSLVEAMEKLVAPIPIELQSASDGQSNGTSGPAKRPAPKSSGCRIEGFVRVKKVPGNLVITALSGAHSFDPSQINVSHFISHFSFGKKISRRTLLEMRRLAPHLGGSHDRLAGQSYITHREETNANVTIEHYLQVVKTEIISRQAPQEQEQMAEYEYTAHSSLVHSLHVPAAKFHFEPSPMQVLVTEDSKSFSHFITNLCAIIGGIFTVAGILDSLLHNTMRLMKKVELGKHI